MPFKRAVMQGGRSARGERAGAEGRSEFDRQEGMEGGSDFDHQSEEALFWLTPTWPGNLIRTSIHDEYDFGDHRSYFGVS